ncbi:hypothetical protein M3Y97_00476300 [Aphelenchoides bicaudatus]|nr:hypothetical protein M3Y97_00476300 [Aphelenchoides bicaudatus]
MLPPEPKPQMGLALSDLQQSTSNGQTYSIGGAGISGLAISSHNSGSSWTTRGLGGIGAASSSFGGLSGSSNYGISGLSNNGAGSQFLRTFRFIATLVGVRINYLALEPKSKTTAN